MRAFSSAAARPCSSATDYYAEDKSTVEPELILHHYDFSSFSEKVRLVLGMKGIEWRSAWIPSTLPKPDYMPLTGVYRRAPALQIGADIDADSCRTMPGLEERFPRHAIYCVPENVV